LVVSFGDGSPYCLSLRCQRTGHVEPYTATAYRPLDLDEVNGKVLRIDPGTGQGVPDNPFYDPSDPAGVRSKILAYGVRTPFRVQVDRATGEIYVGDVGTDQWEEINRIPTSWDDPETELNFGWPCYEGGDGEPQRVREDTPYCVSRYYEAETELTTAPWFAYPVEEGAALILGPRYRANAYPREYAGATFFGDWERDAFWTYANDELEQFGTSGEWGQPVDIDVSPRGNLAYLGIGTGRLYEIVYVGGEDADDESADAGRWIGLGAAAALGLLLIAGYWGYRRRSPRST
jgi:glucose/arabinose dehydrogenase